MPNRERRTDGATRIASRRLYVDPSKRRVPSYLAVGDGVHRTAACEREIRQPRALLQIREEVEECLLIHCLGRAGDIVVALFELLARRAARPQQMLERGRK